MKQKINRQIKAILFDMMGVLFFKKADYAPDQIVDEIDNIISKVTNDKIFKQEVMEKYKLEPADFENVLDKVVEKYEAFGLLWDLLPELNENYKLGIINNGTSLTLPKFKSKYPIHKYFDIFVSSAIEGIKKPDSRIYLLAAQRLGINPAECLFMDDLEDNAVGAENVGMVSILWKDRISGLEQFKEFLSIE